MSPGFRRLGNLGLLALTAGCRAPLPPALPPPEPISSPDPREVERVIFLVGDPGEALSSTHPLLQRLERDIEHWSGALGRDSAVSLLVLGDMVYPLGLHSREHPAFSRDSSHLMSQVRLVAGPQARAHHTEAYFMAGNHDWGLEEDREGFVRLRNLERFLDAARQETGAQARLVPDAGQGGPYVLDVGSHIRLLILDTAWWLLQADVPEKNEVLRQVEEAMRTAGERQVVFAAHHPFQSAGPHGGNVSLWDWLGLQFLLSRSGAILQDLNSTPYRRLQRGLRAIFQRTAPPLLFAGGHEHSLQVIEGTSPTDPRYTAVSGSASKSTAVGTVPGLRFASPAHGYMRLVIERDGEVGLFVEAAPEGELVCPGRGPEHVPCMERGVASFRTVYSQRLR